MATTKKMTGITSLEGLAVDCFTRKAEGVLVALWVRWQDEKQYEDIATYTKPLAVIAKDCGVQIVRMTASPFGCVLAVAAKQYTVTVPRGRMITWNRIK